MGTNNDKNKGQIILRIDDEYGHHIIRRYSAGNYSIEGYAVRPKDYQSPPEYFFPITQDEVAEEFTKQGKVWRFEEVKAVR